MLPAGSAPSPVPHRCFVFSYKVREEDEGRGVDVTQLRDDVGLLRTGVSMRLSTAPSIKPPTDLVSGLHVYNLKSLGDQEAQVTIPPPLSAM